MEPVLRVSYYSYPSIMKLFLLLCLAGLLPISVSILRTVPHKYDLIKAKMSWPVAQNYCRVMYTDLATILSDTDWLRLKKEAASKGLATSAWVGLYNDINTWRWSLNNVSLKSVTYTNWYSDQPDNYAGKESCGIIDSNAIWWDSDCTQEKTFICYNANFSGAARFIPVSSPLLTWSEARDYCRTHHTDLASSLNSSDNNMIAQLVTFSIYPWIGLYRDTWKWSDGANASGLPWAPGQPDNNGGAENCALVYNGLFSDVPCNNQYYFFCHTMRKQQIVRLQVKSDGSVFDPDVQSSILEQIKEKLEEKGMLNTTVTWKVQPDGNIFYKKNNNDL
ncbi:C-type mannose receptor 2-like [Pangasianodon hypophthalmus]|uniref:C-type mannose receptor 2-like n=1 Tax=Pangasianodon hypophthalmus TaxID=310915 RepID=UPI002307AC9C|nr:C-type mannose receptor 2-like [Pangasianodon hypophthalmus]XP_034157187.2 C-type mannose receptor 2-like [Pangasianodon hypophthalmus]